MDTKTETQKRDEITSIASADTVVGLAIIGCFIAGGIGISKAADMHNGLDVMCCLFGSVAAFGMVFFIYFRRN